MGLNNRCNNVLYIKKADEAETSGDVRMEE